MRSQQVNFPGSGSGAGRALALRQAFDDTFADAAATDPAPLDDLLAIRINGRGFALRLSEVSGLFVDRGVTRLPTTVPELLGIMTVRGALVPVYDLAALLGWPASTQPRWLVIATGTRVGFAFDQLDGHLRIPRQSIIARDDASALRHADAIVKLDEGPRPIVSLPSVLDAIASRVRPATADSGAWWAGSAAR